MGGKLYLQADEISLARMNNILDCEHPLFELLVPLKCADTTHTQLKEIY